jgi:hypothetical protein
VYNTSCHRGQLAALRRLLRLYLPTVIGSVRTRVAPFPLPTVGSPPVDDDDRGNPDQSDDTKCPDPCPRRQHKFEKHEKEPEHEHMPRGERVRVVPDRPVSERGRNAESNETVGWNPPQHERHRQQHQQRAYRFHVRILRHVTTTLRTAAQWSVAHANIPPVLLPGPNVLLRFTASPC